MVTTTPRTSAAKRHVWAGEHIVAIAAKPFSAIADLRDSDFSKRLVATSATGTFHNMTLIASRGLPERTTRLFSSFVLVCVLVLLGSPKVHGLLQLNAASTKNNTSSVAALVATAVKGATG